MIWVPCAALILQHRQCNVGNFSYQYMLTALPAMNVSQTLCVITAGPPAIIACHKLLQVFMWYT